MGQDAVGLSAGLLAQGRYREVLVVVDEALRLQPDAAPSLLINRAVASKMLGDFEVAVAALRQAIVLSPGPMAEAYINLSGTLLEMGRLDEAVTWSEQGLLLLPGRVELRVNRAGALVEGGRFVEALDDLEALLAEGVGDVRGLYAYTLLEMGLWCSALRVIQELAERYGELELVGPLGDTLSQGEEGTALLNRTLADNSASPQFRLELLRSYITALKEQERLAELLSWADRLPPLFEGDRQLAAAWLEALARSRRFDEADELVARLGIQDLSLDGRQPELGGITFTPSGRSLYVDWQFGKLERCDWSNYAPFLAELPDLVEAELGAGRRTPLEPFRALQVPVPVELLFRSVRNYAAHLEAQTLARASLESTKAIGWGAGERIRIGYVSADFRDHATSHLIHKLFRVHDRARFEIFIYSLSAGDGSLYDRAIQAAADRYIDLSTMGLQEAAETIRQDGVTILVDLMGYTRLSRPGLFVLRPAPIQVSYLGFPGSTGGHWFDYILVDPVVLTPEQAAHYSETPAVLPHCYQVTDDEQPIASTQLTRLQVGLPAEGFVFCCFNNSLKLSPTLFATWMRILKAVPDSVLWLYAGRDPLVADNLRREAVRHGIAAERLVFASYMEKSRHLERLQLADLFLDTYTYNAHTTASDALWAGLPLLTVPGEAFPARVALSLLRAVGLEAVLVCETIERYEQQAIALANSPDELAALRRAVAGARHSPLFDTAGFARGIEAAYTEMVRRYSSGEAQDTPLIVSPPQAVAESGLNA